MNRALKALSLAVALGIAQYAAAQDIMPDAYARYAHALKFASPIEGIWQMTDGGAIFAIVAKPGLNGQYTMSILDSPDYTIEPDTPFGTLAATAKPGVFDAKFLLAPGKPGNASQIKKGYDFIVEITDDGRINFTAYHRNKRISLRRWLPYLFRVSVIENSNRPQGLDGALRLYPGAPGTGHVVL